ncbi:MAG: gamma-glutamyl-gamma-aminobutyrate hydrolase family protein [Planctomycetota bacterium]
MARTLQDRPVIGVTALTILRRSALRERPWNAVCRTYLGSLEDEGSLPLILPTASDPGTADAYLDRVDGLLLTGGDDVHPRRFGEEPHPSIGLVDPDRDAFEIALVLAARARDLPVLGICRGIQVINVALGGDLHQDVPSQTDSPVGHRQRTLADSTWHTVEVEAGSRLAAILGAGRIEVNSFHHQAPRRVPADLVVSARTSGDGLIEGLEDPSRKFFLGVQWHPEVTGRAGDEPSRRLFRAFVEAARARERRSSKVRRKAPFAQ